MYYRFTIVVMAFILSATVYGATIEEEVAQAASRFNQNLPMFVDSATRLERTSAAGKNFKYIYTMVNLTKQNANIEAFRQQVIPVARNQYCTSTEMKAFRTYGVSVSHSYFDKHGIELIMFTIRPSDC